MANTADTRHGNDFGARGFSAAKSEEGKMTTLAELCDPGFPRGATLADLQAPGAGWLSEAQNRVASDALFGSLAEWMDQATRPETVASKLK